MDRRPAHDALALVTAQRSGDAEAFCVVLRDMDVDDTVAALACLAQWVVQMASAFAVANGVDPDAAWVYTAARVMEENP